MLTSITLQNFKSFGEEQTIPLRPITVLVGPNNSGKSNLVSLGRFVRNVVEAGEEAALEAEGGDSFLFRRPPVDSGAIRIAWASADGSYLTEFEEFSGELAQVEEKLEHHQHGRAWEKDEAQWKLIVPEVVRTGGRFKPEEHWVWNYDVLSGLKMVLNSSDWIASGFQGLVRSIVSSAEIKLSLGALRQDAEVVPTPRLGVDGSNLAAVLGLWRGSDPDRADHLHEFVRRSIPEIKHVFVKPSPQPAYQRLWFQQTDGQQFDAGHVSDGVLFFTALAMRAIEAEPGSLLFIEEPEQCIHPRRLGMIVDLFRQIVAERKCQIVVVSHSPALLDEFRDEPEAIVLFRRGENGTQVKQLAELPTLVEALRDAQPGEMLANGFFDAPF